MPWESLAETELKQNVWTDVKELAVEGVPRCADHTDGP